ncbi:MAG: hypothetical protein L3J49_11280 [Desulfobulbaceae bacterium]|nr:hypothetical protein [Desulfobulbaceae bacterium]
MISENTAGSGQRDGSIVIMQECRLMRATVLTYCRECWSAVPLEDKMDKK